MFLKNEWMVFLATTSALAMVFLDSTILPVALPTIQRELGISQHLLTWIINAYFVFNTCFVMAGGRVGDLVGHKKIFVLGLSSFAFSSLIGGFATNGWWLVISRACQGLSSAFMLPSGFTLLTKLSRRTHRGRLVGTSAAVASIFLSLGPLLGGLFTECVSWRWAFWINPVIASCGLYLTGMCIPKPTRTETNEAFFDFSLFRSPSFVRGTMIIFLAQFLMMGPIFWSMYFQKTLGYSPIEAGLLTIVSTLPVIFIPPLAGHLMDKVGPRIPSSMGFVLITAAFIFFEYFIPLALLLFGVGISLITTPTGTMTMCGAPEEKRGFAAGVYNTARFVGAALGVGVFSVLSRYMNIIGIIVALLGLNLTLVSLRAYRTE